MIDIHAHILPGVDDGARTMEDALGMLQLASSDGVTKIIATPHVFRGNTGVKDFGQIGDHIRGLKLAAGEAGIDIEILPGAEVHISHDLTTRVTENRDSLTLNGSAYVLVEFPSDHIFPRIKEHFYNLFSLGIKPIIAHPERNLVFGRHPEILYDLVCQGVKTQANSGSLVGVYGKTVQVSVSRLLELNLIHFIGSDCHNLHTLVPKLSDTFDWMVEVYGSEYAEALFTGNPLAVVEDRELALVPDPIDPRPKQRSLRIKMPRFSGASLGKKRS